MTRTSVATTEQAAPTPRSIADRARFAAAVRLIPAAVLVWALLAGLGYLASAFLRAINEELVFLKPTGRFWATTARGSSRNLHLIGRSGRATTLHLEYLIQIGAYAELILDHGWSPASLDFECGAFDVEGGDPRIYLAVEAKARVLPPTGDTLTALRDSLVGSAQTGRPPSSSNHANKWSRLVELTRGGPVWLWLVADRARWSYVARQDELGRVSLHPVGQPPTFELVSGLSRSVLSADSDRAS